ncbi:MAG: SDR family oxidoreductase [Sinobacteraceae bacterium]|nr:SDR family oxidoreductase [Nevskiaceae bacterium]MBV9911398.1 SDR family oxidoreductase [Nevskiaceae bacterium]
MNQLAGKIAVVIGAAGLDNMGQVIARRFAAEGARVMVAGRAAEPLRELATELGGSHAVCDIRRKADVESVARATAAEYGRIDIAINCTGWGLMARLRDTTEEQLDQLMDLQFKGTYFFLQVFAEQLAGSGGGSLITISSASVYALLFNHAAYIGTKAGADALMRCFANEYGARKVKVNAIAPGLTATPMTRREMEMPGLEAAFLKEYPLGRIGTAEDVANAAVWLAGAESFMTGQVLQVNGGLTLRRNPLPREINASLAAAAEKNSQS